MTEPQAAPGGTADRCYVTIDADRCQGHARCVAYCPDVFDFDDEGHGKVVAPGGLVEERHAAAVRAAVENCPERAIAVHERGGEG